MPKNEQSSLTLAVAFIILITPIFLLFVEIPAQDIQQTYKTKNISGF